LACLPARGFAEEKGRQDGPATIFTGLKLLQTCTVDIGDNQELHPHKEGVLAKDKQGNLWISRKISSDPKSKLGFFRKNGGKLGNVGASNPYETMAAKLSRGAGELVGKRVAVLPFTRYDVSKGEAESVSGSLAAAIEKEGKLSLADDDLVKEKLSKLKRKAFPRVGPKTAAWLRKNLRVGGVVVGKVSQTSGSFLVAAALKQKK